MHGGTNKALNRKIFDASSAKCVWVVFPTLAVLHACLLIRSQQLALHVRGDNKNRLPFFMLAALFARLYLMPSRSSRFYIDIFCYSVVGNVMHPLKKLVINCCCCRCGFYEL